MYPKGIPSANTPQPVTAIAERFLSEIESELDLKTSDSGVGPSDHTSFYLMYLLTGFTCVWGVLTGTYFGQEWLPSSVKPLVPWLNVTENIQWLCFTVALVHLSIARIWSILRRFPHFTFCLVL